MRPPSTWRRCDCSCPNRSSPSFRAPGSKVGRNGGSRIRHLRRVIGTASGVRARTAHPTRRTPTSPASRGGGHRGREHPLRGGAHRSGSGPLSEIIAGAGSLHGPQDRFVAALIDAAIEGADEKLSIDTVVLDLREFVDSFDALIIAAGRNDRQVRAIAEEVERRVELALDLKPTRVEGWTTAQWIALDYGDVIVHVFDLETREYYDLEHLWSAAPVFRPAHQR
ncbi:MAG: ribosome silencing factor [Acidobacteria bacterium]|nr:ribosome silencing factor [Acidobacteriota bacterium]